MVKEIIRDEEFLKIKEVDEAKEIINEKFNEYYTPQSEIIDIAESNNRITFSKIESKIDFPPFNRSLKDGFAIKAEDSFGVNEENPKITIIGSGIQINNIGTLKENYEITKLSEETFVTDNVTLLEELRKNL